MDLTIIADLLGSIDPIVLGSAAGGLLIVGGASLYVKRNKNKFIENTDPLAQSNDFKTLKTEDLEREFGSLTVQTKMLDEDESLFFDKGVQDNLSENELTQPSTKFVDEASVFDSFGKQEQAIESLKKSIEIEKYDKEKVRLKILLTQYNIKRGKVSLEQIITEHPSFHTKVVFGPDNTLSALMGSTTPKTDEALKSNINKEIEKEFDIFADLPMLSEKTHVSEQKTEVIDYQKNIFDDLPPLDSVSTQKQLSQPLLNNDLAFSETSKLPVLESSLTKNSPLENLNSLDTYMSSSEKTETINQDSAETNNSHQQLDQFSWTTKSDTENQTEAMLKELQKDADTIDQINENEAIDDMQKFWKEFGSMVVDIKKEVVENHTLTQKDSITNTENETTVKQPLNTEIPFSLVVESKHAIAPSISQLPVITPTKPVVQDSVVAVVEDVKMSNNNLENTSAPVLHDIIKEDLNNAQASQFTPALPIMNEPIKETPKAYKVWANWIVNIEGQQIFKNHFINIKNPWGSIKAGEELYGGINRITGINSAGKTHSWVLVSVFPLTKD